MGHLRRLTLAKKQRLVKNRQFRAVLDHRKRVSDGLLVMYVAPNHCTWPRLGISVGRSCGSAVVRNRFKRLIRESFRLEQDQWPDGWDILVMVNSRWRSQYEASEKNEQNKVGLEHVRRSLLGLRGRAEKRRWFEPGLLEERGDG